MPDAASEIAIEGVHVSRDGRAVLQDVTLTLRGGELVCLIGANGAGKTTLLRAALGLQKIDRGSVRLDGAPIATFAPDQRARRVAYLPQARTMAWPLIVRDTVALGRFAYGARLGRLSDIDAAAVDEALAACSLSALATRAPSALSGGEAALVHVARALASKTQLVLADEPIAALDPRHAWNVMGVLRTFVEAGGGALVTIHGPNLAAEFATRLIVMDIGRVIADGAARQTLTADIMRRAFGVSAVGLVGGGVRVTGVV